MAWTWAPGSVLHSLGPHTAPKDVFLATCAELGRWFASKGFKYTASRPKLVLSDGDLSLKLTFWSSRSNSPGQYVALELVSFVESRRLKKWVKTSGVGRNGALASFSMFDPGTQRYEKSWDVAPITPEAFAEMAATIEEKVLTRWERVRDLEKTIAAALSRDQSWIDVERDLIKDNFYAYLLMCERRDEAERFAAAWPVH